MARSAQPKTRKRLRLQRMRAIQSKLADRRHLFEAAAPEERPFKV